MSVVGGAALSAFFSVLFDKLASQFLEHIKNLGVDDTQLQRLKNTITTVYVVLSNADELQFLNPLVKQLMDELNDVIYLAEDLVDEVNYLVVAKNQGKCKTSITNFNDKFEKMILKLENAVKHRDIFDLMKKGIGEKTSPRLPTTSRVDESKTYGRELDKSLVMKFLMNGNAVGEIPVIAIWGLAGVGKTTFAQLLYNDSEVEKHFSKRVWVHVSDTFDVLKVCRTILHSLTFQDCNVTDLDLIQDRLQKALNGKRLLLVLDDVWNENFSYWDALRYILKDWVQEGSRIIVTTRNQDVASTMHAIFIHHLPLLSDDHCQAIFEAHAFEDDGYHNHPNLKLIGEKIVKNCQGLPLVAKLLGSLLHSKVEASEWEAILKAKIWDFPSDKTHILHSLGMSYCHLPPNLKKCFSYCSLFPKGYIFEKEKLVLLWKAEGFLPSGSYKTMEEVGNEYFEELVSRSFFQVCGDGKPCFIMHDLINDLAQFVSGESCFTFEIGKSSDISRMAYRFSYVVESFDSTKDIFKALGRVEHLRTMLPLSISTTSGRTNQTNQINNIATKNFTGAKSKLRVLSLFNYKIENLSFGILMMHLRYLDCSYNPIRTLPDSTCLLFNLETLVLAHCTNLIELPKDLGNLINLGYIDLRETESLERMPPAFGKLENLQTLTKFVVSSCANGSNISELGKLLNLNGELSISDLQNVKDDIDVENANLKDKKNLKGLIFVWDKTVACDIIKATVVLEKLQPHENIEKLFINGYSGTKLPDWLGDSSYSNMAVLYLNGCKNCLSLPSLGQLSSLEELYVEGMDNLQSIGSEFYGGPSSVTSFESLRILKFVNMPVWKEWLSPAIADQQFSKLFKLDLLNCENLTGKLLPCYLPLLEELYMKDCLKLKFPCDDANIKYEKLRILKIENSCDALWAFDLNSFEMLEDLFIDNCSLLINIRVPKEAHLSIKKLEIRNCNNFRGFLDYYAAHFPSIMTLSLSHCRELLSFPKGGLPSNLQSLMIEKCHLVTAMDAWGLNNMASLTHLTIIGGSLGLNLKSFPAKGLLPASLTSLVFGEFRELEILDLNGLELLSSLEMVEIKTCVRLRSMSEDGRLPDSLSSLEISECLMLTERCQYGGEDWEKISCITNKVINGEVM